MVESVDVCAWPQLTHRTGVYFFALLSKEACVLGDTGSESRVYITRSMRQSVLAIFPYNENISAEQYALARMGPSTVINHFCDHTWLENAVPFSLTPFGDNIQLCDSHHLKRFVALLSDCFSAQSCDFVAECKITAKAGRQVESQFWT